VIHNYRWRLGLADGESKYDDLEKQLAAGPVIAVPTITLEGDANSAPHPDPGSYAKKFSGKYKHRLLNGGIGHNLPQEAPRQFADAIIGRSVLTFAPAKGELRSLSSRNSVWSWRARRKSSDARTALSGSTASYPTSQ